MNEILKMLNALSAEELDSVIMRANIILEKKRKEEAEAAEREKERKRRELLEQEKRRQAEIAELQRKLRELQNQKINIPEESGTTVGSNFVMYDAPKPTNKTSAPAAKPVSAQPQAASRPSGISCPNCRTMNVAGSQFCESCGKKLTAPSAEPKPQPAPRPSGVTCPNCRHLNQPGSMFCESCGRKIVGGQTAQSPAPRSGSAQVRYAEDTMKEWQMVPGETSIRARHEIEMRQPDGGKYAYYMEVTNRRILLTRESKRAKNAAVAASIGGGFLGALIAEGVKSASGSGPKPWLEIPLTAVSNCGIRDQKEFFIVADQTYVFVNKNYENVLPDAVARAKRGVF